MGGLGLRNLLHLQAEISWLSLGPDQSWGAKVSMFSYTKCREVIPSRKFEK